MNDDLGDGKRETRLGDDLQRFADDLARLRPREDRLDRERLAFLAGQASVSRRGRAWPVAFGAMSAVAASLLFLLVMRPETSADRPFRAAQPVHDAERTFVIDSVDDRRVLSPRDALRIDFEARLAINMADRDHAGIVPGASAVRDIPIFTPSAWHQVIQESESHRPSSHDESGYHRVQGVRS